MEWARESGSARPPPRQRRSGWRCAWLKPAHMAGDGRRRVRQRNHHGAAWRANAVRPACVAPADTPNPKREAAHPEPRVEHASVTAGKCKSMAAHRGLVTAGVECGGLTCHAGRLRARATHQSHVNSKARRDGWCRGLDVAVRGYFFQRGVSRDPGAGIVPMVLRAAG